MMSLPPHQLKSVRDPSPDAAAVAAAAAAAEAGKSDKVQSRTRGSNRLEVHHQLPELLTVIRRTDQTAELLPSLRALRDVTAWNPENQVFVAESEGGLAALRALIGDDEADSSSTDNEISSINTYTNTHSTGNGKSSAMTITGTDNGTISDSAVADKPYLLEEDAKFMALCVLINVTTNDSISKHASGEPGLIQTLVDIMGQEMNEAQVEKRRYAVYAARCLINLTHTDGEARESAEEAGAVTVAIQQLLRNAGGGAPCRGLLKVSVWLLMNLTSGYSTQARTAIAGAEDVTQQLLVLAGSKESSIAVLSATIIANLARIGTEWQAHLASSGAPEKLLLALPKAVDKRVSAAILGALSALSLGSAEITDFVATHPTTLPTINRLLRGTPLTAFGTDSDDAKALLALHVLIHILGYMVLSTAAASVGGPMGRQLQVARMAADGADDGHLTNTDSDGEYSHLARSDTDDLDEEPGGSPCMQPYEYMDLATASAAFGLVLPHGRAVTLHGGVSGDDGADGSVFKVDAADCALHAIGEVRGEFHGGEVSAAELGELRYLVNDELLPRLRQHNALVAAGAVARLYQLAMCEGAVGEAGRQMMAEPNLLRQLLRLLGSREEQQDPHLVMACLCVLDVLSERVPACQWMLLEAGWLDRVVPLLDDDRDLLVRRFAERALCSISSNV